VPLIAKKEEELDAAEGIAAQKQEVIKKRIDRF